jgi:RND family efflux transporter MFP subunit
VNESGTNPDPAESELPAVSGPTRATLTTLIVVAALGAGAWGISLVGEWMESRKREAPRAAPHVTRVRVLELESIEAPLRVKADGFLAAPSSIRIPAEVAGVLLERKKDVGDPVALGEVVAVIDAEILEAQLAGARARAAAWDARIGFLRRERDRFARLADARSVGSAELERVASELASAEASRAESLAAIAELEIRVRKCRVLASCAGVWFENHAEAGEFLQVGQPIGTVRVVDELELEVDVDSSTRLALAVGDPVQVELLDVDPTIDSGVARLRTATVMRLPAGADEISRRFPVVVRIANNDGALVPGLFARAVFALERPDPILLLPKECVFDRLGRSAVWALRDDGARDDGVRTIVEARSIEVRELEDRPGFWRIASGVSAGERVVLSPIEQLAPGVEVVVEVVVEEASR